MSADRLHPLIGISSDLRDFNGVDMFGTGYKYVEAVIRGAGGIPVILPSLGDREIGGMYQIDELIDRLDGLILTGGRSNVEPHHYDGAPFRHDTLRDPLRDMTTLPLARKAIRDGLPIFGICRGIQEINVALGGSLHPYLWEVEGKNDHRMPQTEIMEHRYALRHPVHLREDGLFAELAGKAGLDPREVMVNSLHGQGIDRLAEGLVAEAVSDDGVIEGVSMPDAPGLVLAVQWHAEFKVEAHAFNRALWEAFGTASRRRAAARAGADVA